MTQTATRKKAAKPAAQTHISHTTISQNAAPANEHTAASIVSLAEALEETARSCGELAKAIARSGGVFNGHGISISGDNP